MTYDASGNIVRVSRTDDRYEERVANFYAADQRLRVVDRRACLRFPDSSVNCDPTADPGTGKRGAFEEYRYDALGRRIWVRSRSDSSCHVSWADCESVVERYVWDGDQSLYEIRAPGGDQAGLGTESDNGHDVNRWRYGRVAYTHAGGIDQPVGLVRMKYYGTSDNEAFPVILHTNWRGTFDKGTNPNGSEITGCGDPSTCVAIAWPGKAMSMFFESNTLYSGPPTWFGSFRRFEMVTSLCDTVMRKRGWRATCKSLSRLPRQRHITFDSLGLRHANRDPALQPSPDSRFPRLSVSALSTPAS